MILLGLGHLPIKLMVHSSLKSFDLVKILLNKVKLKFALKCSTFQQQINRKWDSEAGPTLTTGTEQIGSA